ncbi:MAG: PDZ domain-containing protein [Candidatus Brocadiia bacterium]
MRKALASLIAFCAFVAILPLATFAENADSDAALCSNLLNKYSAKMCGVSITTSTTNANGDEEFTTVWTPGVFRPDSTVLVSYSALPENPLEKATYRIASGKLRARAEIKAINQRYNIAVMSTSINTNDLSVSFSENIEPALGTKYYAIGVLPADANHIPCISPFLLTSVVSLQNSTLYTANLALNMHNPTFLGGLVITADGKVIGFLNVLRADDTDTLVLRTAASVREAISTAIDPRDTSMRRCWFGAFTSALSPAWVEKLKMPSDLQGSLVEDVIKGSPADTAGLKTFDVITSINGLPLAGPDAENLEQFFSRNFKPNETAKLGVFRAGERLEVSALLTESPKTTEEAPKYADDKLGVEVRDLTTYARVLLGLSVDSKSVSGVLVFSMDQRKTFGAAVLRQLGINYSYTAGLLITEVDGKSVASADDFKKAVEDARKAKAKSMTIFVRYNNADENGCLNTCFVKVNFED